MNTMNLFAFSAVSTLFFKSTLLITGCLLLSLLMRKCEPRWRVLLVRGTVIALPVLLAADFLAPVIVLKWRTEKVAHFAVEEPVKVLSAAPIYPGSVNVVPEIPAALVELPATQRSSMSIEQKAGLTAFGVWLIGVFCFLCRDLLARRGIRREAQTAQDAASALESEWRCACDEFALIRPPLLRVSPLEKSPFLIAGGKTLLVIPASLSANGPQVQRLRKHVFRHEAAHIAGGDLRWMAVMRLCVRLLWFQPLVWALEKLHLSACEEAADAEAARRGGSREYRGALAQMALDLLPVGAPATALLRAPSVVKRLRAVGDHVSKRRPTGRASLSLLASLLLSGFVVGNLGMKSVGADDSPDYEAVEAALAVKMGEIDFDGVRLAEAVSLLQIAVESAVTDGESFPLRIRLGDGVSGDTIVILRLDQATFEDVVEYLARFAGGRHRVENGEIIIEVSERRKIIVEDTSEGRQAAVDTSNDPAGAVEAIEKLLKTIVLPAVEFRDTPLKEALQFLTARAAELYGDEELPFTFVVDSEAADALDTRITLRLTNVPLREALRYVTSLAQVKFAVEPHSILIRPVDYHDAELYTNVYQVPPTAFSTEASASDAKQVLESAGIAFGEGAAAVFNPATSRLIVRNTQSQMELVEFWIDEVMNVLPADPSDQWFRAYLVMKDGEEAESKGEPAEALWRYQQGKNQLDTIASTSPEFHPAMVRYRQKHMSDKIESLKAQIVQNADINDLLKRIVLPRIDFRDAPLVGALAALEKMANASNQANGEKISIRLLDPDDDNADAEITLRLGNVPLVEALRYTTSLANRVYKVTDDDVVVVTKEDTAKVPLPAKVVPVPFLDANLFPPDEAPLRPGTVPLPSAPVEATEPLLSIGKVAVSTVPFVSEGDTTRLSVELLASDPATIESAKVNLMVEFFDIIDGKNLGPGVGEVVMKFSAKPYRWIGSEDFAHPFVSEAVVVEYFLPKLKPGDEGRRYYGYTAELYYDGVLQSVTAKPSKLLRFAP